MKINILHNALHVLLSYRRWVAAGTTYIKLHPRGDFNGRRCPQLGFDLAALVRRGDDGVGSDTSCSPNTGSAMLEHRFATLVPSRPHKWTVEFGFLIF